MRLSILGSLRFALAAAVALTTTSCAEQMALLECDADNGGIQLPDGFCAFVVADALGAARHLDVAPNGDIFVAIRNQPNASGGIIALRDTDGDGRADLEERFGEDGGTSIQLRGDYLYFGRDNAIVRYPMTSGELVPDGPAEVIATLPDQRSHASKGFAFDGEGGLYVNGQTQASGTRYATGMRQNFAMAWHPSAAGLHLVQHGRDQLNTLWEGFTEEQNAELPSEEFMRVEEGSNFGWPYCYHDWQQDKRVLSPEYSGDGMEVGRCAEFDLPLIGFPGHWAPNALMFYTGGQFPERYRGGAFIVFHGSWNRAPLPQDGYKVVFVPFDSDGPATDDYEIFADGFAGQTPLMDRDDAPYRPSGIAVGPDGSVYISNDRTGRIWRVMYRGA